jgi:hypothetical protein
MGSPPRLWRGIVAAIVPVAMKTFFAVHALAAKSKGDR